MVTHGRDIRQRVNHHNEETSLAESTGGALQDGGVEPVDARWFGASRVLGLDGRPLVAHHGTRSESWFDVPVPSRYGAQGPGVYMADRLSSYGERSIPLYVRMLNPFVFHPSDESIDADVNGELIEQALPRALARRVLRRMNEHGVEAYGTEVQDALRARGHDGIVMVYPEGEPMILGIEHEAVIIAFESSQLRRAGPDVRSASRLRMAL